MISPTNTKWWADFEAALKSESGCPVLPTRLARRFGRLHLTIGSTSVAHLVMTDDDAQAGWISVGLSAPVFLSNNLPHSTVPLARIQRVSPITTAGDWLSGRADGKAAMNMVLALNDGELDSIDDDDEWIDETTWQGWSCWQQAVTERAPHAAHPLRAAALAARINATREACPAPQHQPKPMEQAIVGPVWLGGFRAEVEIRRPTWTAGPIESVPYAGQFRYPPSWRLPTVQFKVSGASLTAQLLPTDTVALTVRLNDGGLELRCPEVIAQADGAACAQAWLAAAADAEAFIDAVTSDEVAA